MLLYNKTNRRHFLRGLSGAALYLPPLVSLLPRKLQAQNANNKFFCMIHCGHGQYSEDWYPNPASFTFTEQTTYRHAKLSQISSQSISPVLSAEMNPLREKLLLLSRVSYSNDEPNHSPEALMTGATLSHIQSNLATMSSIDHLISRKLANKSPLTLKVNFQDNYPSTQAISVKAGQLIIGQSNPATLFNNLFRAGSNPADNRMPDRKIVDLVLDSYKDLRRNPRLASEDLAVLDQTIEMYSELEADIIAADQQQSCQGVSGPVTSPVQSGQSADYEVVLDQMLLVMQLAIRCGMTRSISLMLHPYDYTTVTLDFLGLRGNFHSHTGHCTTDGIASENRADKLRLMQFYSKKIAGFLSALDEVVDVSTGKTLLDQGLIAYMNDIGADETPQNHADSNLPILLAGGAGGFFKTGYYVDYGKRINDPYIYGNALTANDNYSDKFGVIINHLLVTILQSMGLSPNDYELPGQMGYGYYGNALTLRTEQAGFSGHRRNPLPFIVRGTA